MDTLTVPAPLRHKIGPDASEGLVDMFAAYHQFSTDRYERRLTEETAAIRIELHQGLAGIRVEIARTRADLMKWSLLMWIGQFAAILGAMSFMLQR